MNNPNSLFGMAALALAIVTGLACSSLTGNSGSTTNTAATPAVSNASSANSTTANSTATQPAKNVEKADFTTTSEALDKEYTRDGVTSKDLEKYSNKNIAVSGRVTMLVTEKKGTTQPWVTLYAPGTLHGVNCYFDDENVGQMKMLKEDQNAKVQGFQDDFIVPKVSPMLKHCVVLEGAP